ncbi:MAG: hypothetical protein ACO1NX_06590, partial [Chitinophagaceae bacterium]
MTLQHYHAMDQEAQRWWVLHNGVYLCNRKTRDFTVFLFALESFYVEMYFYNVNDLVFLIKSFDSTD